MPGGTGCPKKLQEQKIKNSIYDLDLLTYYPALATPPAGFVLSSISIKADAVYVRYTMAEPRQTQGDKSFDESLFLLWHRTFFSGEESYLGLPSTTRSPQEETVVNGCRAAKEQVMCNGTLEATVYKWIENGHCLQLYIPAWVPEEDASQCFTVKAVYIEG